MSSASFYNWRSKYGGMDASLISQMKAINDENKHLKKLFWVATYAERASQGGLGKKIERPSQRQEMAERAVRRRGVSITLACQSFGLSETCYRYIPKLKSENERIGDLLIGLTKVHKTWGVGLYFLHLRNFKGHLWNRKRVYPIYLELELNLRIKPRKGLVREKLDELAVPEAPNKSWSMGFMADRLGDGRAFRVLNVLDDFNHEGLAIDLDYSLTAERVIRSVNQINEWNGKPKSMRVDNGPEYVSGKLMEWAEKRNITVQHIQPAKPPQNAYIEHHNRTVRHE